MQPGVTNGLSSPATQTFYFDLLTASNGSPTQPVGVTRFAGGGQRNMIRYYDDGEVIHFQMHVSFSQVTSIGTGDAFVVRLPVPAKRLIPGANDRSAKGEGICYFALVNPAPNIKCIATLADPWTSLLGEEDNYLQFMVPYSLSYNTTSVLGTASSKTVNHTLGLTPSAADINVAMDTFPAGATRKASTIKPVISSVGATSFVVTPQYPFYRTNIIGQCGTGQTVSANRFFPINSGSGAPNTTNNGAGSFVTVPGNAQTYTIDNFYVAIDTADANNGTRTFTVQKNGTDTALTTTIAGTVATSNSDTTHSFTCVSGDQLCLRTSDTGTTTSTGGIRWTMRATATTNKNMSLMGGSVSSVSNSATNYLPVQGLFQSATAVDSEMTMPNAGTLQNAQCVLTGVAGGTSYTFTLYKNGSPTAITFAVTALNSTGSDTTHTVSYVQSDRLYWECVPAGTPTARGVAISLETVPTVAGESVHGYASSATVTVAADRYMGLSHSASASGSATESLREGLSQAAQWKKMAIYTTVVPAAGKTEQVSLSIAGSTTSTPTATITNAGGATATDNSTTASSTVGQTVSFLSHPTGSPASFQGQFGVVSYMRPDIAADTLGAGNDWAFDWQIRAPAQDNASQIVNPTVPWAWGSFKNIYLSGSYEKRIT